MSDIVKWGLLVAGALALIALIVALPFTDYLNISELGSQIGILVDNCGGYLLTARGLINIFLPPFGRTILNGLMGYIMLKWVVKLGIKTTAWIYHFIFK